ncbi:MAG: hypothetical protein GXO70_09065 [Acidobacteria bacterium]|nr:hypothetical protein [Acidobacteriota bacterium]
MRDRMLILVYSSILDNAVREVLDEMNVCGFTELENVKGKGPRTGFHLGTSVYPDLNNMLFIIEDAEKIAVLADELKKMEKEFPDEGLKLFTVPIEEL